MFNEILKYFQVVRDDDISVKNPKLMSDEQIELKRDDEKVIVKEVIEQWRPKSSSFRSNEEYNEQY